MKKIVAILAAIALLVALASCGGGGGAAVSTEDAEAVFVLSLSLVVMTSFVAAFGQEVEGVSLGEDNVLTFDKFSLSAFGEGDPDADLPFETMSGTVGMSEAGGMVADLTFDGGPVESLEYELEEGVDLEDMDDLEVTVKVNGRSMDLLITEEKIQSLGG